MRAARSTASMVHGWVGWSTGRRADMLVASLVVLDNAAGLG